MDIKQADKCETRNDETMNEATSVGENGYKDRDKRRDKIKTKLIS
jgi:hypothetical protein